MNFLNKTIQYSFYLLFLLIPLIFAGNTSELFEFNKMWLTFGLTVIILVSWLTKMVLEKKVLIQRTPLDIPIFLFLLSQLLATIFSLDQHVSWWGYYSRFNGGLLSTLTYIALYYAFVSNLSLQHIFKTLKFILVGGLITAIWGFPSHFGYDPTCYLFRGSLDTACWTDAFKPTIRAFSTLGQPAWFAAYLAVLIPLALAFALNATKKSFVIAGLYLALAMLLYSNLLFTNTRAGFLAFVVANALFWGIIFLKRFFPTQLFLKYFLCVNALFVIFSFFFGSPIGELQKYTLPGIQASQPVANPPSATTAATPTTPPAASTEPAGGTDSGNIRLYVWQGAIDAWKASPLFGTGVETFAFAYYQFRPQGHNATSEWDYLYNKAHNEYLNYLTTTGLLGLGTYLTFLGVFSFIVIKPLVIKRKNDSIKQTNFQTTLLTTGLFAGWTSLLISNFFGFSVVITNLFLFLIPAFVFILQDMLNPEKKWEFPLGTPSHTANPYQWTVIVIFWIIAGMMLIDLYRYWYADTKYALGSNLNRVGNYQEAYPFLLEAATIKPNEPVYTDELATNLSVLGAALAAQNDTTNANQFISNAIALNNELTKAHPNNLIYWKNRVRIFYTLARQVGTDQQLLYYQEALKAIQHAQTLAPTDAKISYNLGVLYGQTGDIPKGIETLEKTITLKPDYQEPYLALGLFYRQLAVNENNIVINPEYQKKAIETYKYILQRFNPNDEEVKKSLTDWGAQ